MIDELPELEWPEHSLLEGAFVREWAAVGLGTHSVAFNAGARVASPRSTTSSRTPGKVNRGTVYRRASSIRDEDHHLCGCGQQQHLCLKCLRWVCEAPGHLKHDCKGGL